MITMILKNNVGLTLLFIFILNGLVRNSLDFSIRMNTLEL